MLLSAIKDSSIFPLLGVIIVQHTIHHQNLNGRFRACTARNREPEGISPFGPYCTTTEAVIMSIQEKSADATASIYDEDGRTVLPQDVREQLGVGKGDKVQFNLAGGAVVITKVEQDRD